MQSNWSGNYCISLSLMHGYDAMECQEAKKTRRHTQSAKEEVARRYRVCGCALKAIFLKLPSQYTQLAVLTHTHPHLLPPPVPRVLEAWENSSSYSSAVGDDEKSFAFRQASRNALPSSCKRQKVMNSEEGPQRVSSLSLPHITVERNRRKQMNEHLSVLRSLMPCFYVKRGDQASVIGGVVDYIKELQQVVKSLEAKKQRKAACNEVLSPRVVASKGSLSLPISPRTPQPSSTWLQPPAGSLPSPVDPSPCNSSTSSSIHDALNELVATSKSAVAEIEVKFSGANLLLKTVSHRVPGQVLKIVSALEELALEILHVSITTVDEKMLNSFTIKIGIQCQLSAEELAEQIQHTFCCC